MTFILKVMSTPAWSPVPSDNEHSLFADIVTVNFSRDADGMGWALCYVREPIKTAMVPGFCEVEKRIQITDTAYVMNEDGKTISTFTAKTSGHAHARPELLSA